MSMTSVDKARPKRHCAEDYDMDSGNDERAPLSDSCWPEENDHGKLHNLFENDLINAPRKVIFPDIIQLGFELDTCMHSRWCIIFSFFLRILLLPVLVFAVSSLFSLLEWQVRRISINYRKTSKWVDVHMLKATLWEGLQHKQECAVIVSCF